MADYFVRRCGAMNGTPYPEMWFDSPHPSTSVEHKGSVKEAYEVTAEHKASYENYVDAFQADKNSAAVGFDRGRQLFPWSFMEWLDKVQFAPKENE